MQTTSCRNVSITTHLKVERTIPRVRENNQAPKVVVDWARFRMVVIVLLCVFAISPYHARSVEGQEAASNRETDQPNIETVQPVAADSWPANPASGTTVVFLGDSITHQSLYTQYLEDFFWTRYPDRELRFFNAGVAGDSVADAMARFDWDVAVHQPDYVTVLFGMNDGRYEGLDASNFVTYQNDMRRLMDKIESIGANAILLSPTMFDHAVTRWRANDPQWRFRGKAISDDYNSIMGLYGGWAREASRQSASQYVDLWGPLNTLTDFLRRDDSDATLIGDAIHPQASGHVVIATEILSQLGSERRGASTITLAKRGQRWVGGKGVTDLRVSDDERRIEFVHQAVSLPWIIPESHSTKSLRWQLPSDGRLGYQLTRAGHRLSADRIKFAGLLPGTYEVRIDDHLVGSWNHIALGTKVELQANQATPQYQQSLRVAEWNRRRNDEFIRPIRDSASRVKRLKTKFADDPAGLAKTTSRIQDEIAELRRQAEELEEKIRLEATPQPRRWQIRWVDR